MNNASSFLFVKSVTTDDWSHRGAGWCKKPFEWSYEPSSEEEEEWISKGMKDQIWSTVSCLQEKELKDNEKVYIVLGVESQFVPNEDQSKIRRTIFYQNTLRLTRNLSAEVLCYLNSQHTNLLVSCRLSDLTRLLNKQKFRLKYFDTVKRISLLLPKEQISEHLTEDSEWSTQSKEVLIELIPNISTEKKSQYAKTVVQHLTSLDKPARSCCDDDFIVTKLDENAAKEFCFFSGTSLGPYLSFLFLLRLRLSL